MIDFSVVDLSITCGLYQGMAWSVILHEAFDPEYELLPTSVQDSIAAASMLLMEFGPMPGRPHVDTLAGSAHANMKELRFAADDGV